MLYIGNYLSYKPRDDLCIYKTTELEFAFIELINTKKSYVIIRAIYRHPSMDLDEFNDIYLNYLLSKFIKLKDAALKSEAHFKHKQYRKLISTLLKRSKHSNFKTYFQTNINDLKNT